MVDEDNSLEIETLEEEENYGQLTEAEANELLESIEINKGEPENIDPPHEDVIEDTKTNKKKSKNKTKEKATISKSDKEITVDNLVSEFNQFLNITYDIQEDYEEKIVIPTPIELLNTILGGGFAAGTFSIITGSPGSFKSTLLAQCMGRAQEIYKNELFISEYLDSEQAMSTKRLADMGVIYPKIKPRLDIKLETVFKTLEALCVFKESNKIEVPSMIAWDSIRNTLSEKEANAEDPNSVIGQKARILSLLIPKYVSKCAKHNICFIAINQLTDKISMGQFNYQAPDLKLLSNNKEMPGGTILKYNAFHLLEMNLRTVVDEEKYGFKGFIVSVKCVKNKLFTPNIKIDMVGSFTRGFSNFWTNYNFLVDTKRIKTGAWNNLINYEKNFRTRDAYEVYKTDEKFRESFKELVKDAIQKDLIEPNTTDNYERELD